MAKTFSDQIRQAIQQSGVSLYAVGKACKIDKGNLSKFMAGHAGVSLRKIDQIAAMLGLQVSLDPKKEVEHGKRD